MSESTASLTRYSFDQLIARADDQTLQQLVGRHAVRLLDALDPKLTTPSRLREICLQLHSPLELLRDRKTRALLLALLPRERAHDLASLLGLGEDEPYTSLLTLKIRRESKIERDLLEFFSVARYVRPPPQDVEVVSELTPSYLLFDHQRSARRRVLETLNGSEPRVVLHMPTGSGKTRTAMHIATDILRLHEPTVVVWLAYSEELCEQAASEFDEAWECLGDRQIDVHRYWGGTADLSVESVRDGFLVGGLGKMFERARRDGDFISRLADRTSLVIIDEAHQAIAPTYKFLLDYLVERRDDTGLLGLTATPGRTWNDPAADLELAAFFRQQKVSLQVPNYRSPVDYLIDNGYLARLHFRPMAYDGGGHLTDRELRVLSVSLDVPVSILKRLAEDEQRNMIVVDAVEELAGRHPRTLVFAATVDHAKLIATVLQARHMDAVAITSDTPRDERSRSLARFKSNSPEPMILCNFGVLTTGFDAPRTSAAVIARPTKSLVLYSQMIGRATRGPRAGGNADAEVVSVVDSSLPGFGELSEMFDNWEDVWSD